MFSFSEISCFPPSSSYFLPLFSSTQCNNTLRLHTKDGRSNVSLINTLLLNSHNSSASHCHKEIASNAKKGKVVSPFVLFVSFLVFFPNPSVVDKSASIDRRELCNDSCLLHTRAEMMSFNEPVYFDGVFPCSRVLFSHLSIVVVGRSMPLG